MPSRHRIPMFHPCYRITDVVDIRREADCAHDPETKTEATMLRGDSLPVQLARAKRLAAAIRHEAARQVRSNSR